MNLRQVKKKHKDVDHRNQIDLQLVIRGSEEI